MFFNRRRRCRNKAPCVSAGRSFQIFSEPMKWAKDVDFKSYRPFHGLSTMWLNRPCAHAQGFMLNTRFMGSKPNLCNVSYLIQRFCREEYLYFQLKLALFIKFSVNLSQLL